MEATLASSLPQGAALIIMGAAILANCLGKVLLVLMVVGLDSQQAFSTARLETE